MIGGTVAWLVERFTLMDMEPRWPATLTLMCVGTVLVLTLLSLPVVLLASNNVEPPIPPARVHDSSG